MTEIGSLKDQKRRPIGGGEWELQNSFETFEICPKIDPQKAHNQKL
jgi:hypothetical protein